MILDNLKSYIRQHPKLLTFVRFCLSPCVTVFGFLYGSYLTIRYVNEYKNFPAIRFDGGIIRLKIRKSLGGKLILKGNLIVTPFLGGNHCSCITIGCNAELVVENDFVVGDDVRICLSKDSCLQLVGKVMSSGSGITCQCKILVSKFILIGADTIISWGAYITDSDNHPINGTLSISPVVIGEHVWLSSGCQILKGCKIGKNSIIAAQSVILQGDYPDSSFIAGIPAKVRSIAPLWSRD